MVHGVPSVPLQWRCHTRARVPGPKRGPGGASRLRESGAPPNTPTNSTPHLVMVIFADSGTVCDRQYEKAHCTRLLPYGRDGTYSEHLALFSKYTNARTVPQEHTHNLRRPTGRGLPPGRMRPARPPWRDGPRQDRKTRDHSPKLPALRRTPCGSPGSTVRVTHELLRRRRMELPNGSQARGALYRAALAPATPHAAACNHTTPCRRLNITIPHARASQHPILSPRK